MTDWVTWFRQQLQASADGFVWAFEQLPVDQWHLLPPNADSMGTWTPLRHVWHVTGYEEMLVVPSMQQWVGGPIPDNNSWHDDDDTFAADQAAGLTAAEIIARFRAVRQKQLDLIEELTGVDWEAPRLTLWGHRPLKMIVTKTYQHTFEHGDTLLRMALGWQEGDPATEARRLLEAGEAALVNRAWTTARTCFTQSQTLFRTAGMDRMVLSNQHHLGRVAFAEGDLVQARTLQEEMLCTFQAQNFTPGMAATLHQLGLVAMKEGKLDEARTHLSEALRLWQTTRSKKELEATYTLLTLLAP